MIPTRRTEPERIAIGFAWSAAALLCVFVFPEIEELRALMGSLVLSLFGIAGLMISLLVVCRASSRGKRMRSAGPQY